MNRKTRRLSVSLPVACGLLLLLSVPACGPSTSPMQGKAAPDFELPLLDGGTVDLAQIKGEQLVVLDFWATWCPPCREGMPAMAKLEEKYAEQPVAVYAVNLGESNDTVRRFLDQANLDITVAMDAQGEVARQYDVSSIPTTMVIDWDGVVHASHIGYSAALMRNLEKAIDNLLTQKETPDDTA